MACGVFEDASNSFGSWRLAGILRHPASVTRSVRQFGINELEMNNQSIRAAANRARSNSSSSQHNVWFLCSAFMFHMGVALVTFEQVRPLGIMLSDYCFLISLIFIPKSGWLKSTGSGVLLAGTLILSGALLSVRDTSRLADASGSLL